jgi:hypothetical protein
VLENLGEIPGIDPLATGLALYEMLVLIFRSNAEARSKISREVTHAHQPLISGGSKPLCCFVYRPGPLTWHKYAVQAMVPIGPKPLR